MELVGSVKNCTSEDVIRGRITSGFGYGFATFQNPAWNLSQILLATGGRVLSGSLKTVFRSISTDSRSVEPGDLFLALTGDRFDGHAFVREALKKGAAGLIVSNMQEIPGSVPVVLVKDTLEALGDLAAYRRSRTHALKVLGVTGSSGKTTVKEMVAAILGQGNRVLKTMGNLNNLVGLPLSLLSVGFCHDFAVLEMGMNRPGEIDRLTEIAEPDVSCIVNVQDAHLAGLGNINGVAKAKGELFLGSKSWAILAVNIDDKRIRSLARSCDQKKITFGRNRKADVRATHLRSLGVNGMAFTLHIRGEKTRVNIKGLGRHNVMNSLAAAAMAVGVGVDIHEIGRGLSLFEPFDRRQKVDNLAGGLKLLDDSYNANPASMQAALETLLTLGQGRKTVAVLGDMLELGDQSESAHHLIGESVVRHKIDYLLAVGDFAQAVVRGAVDSGMAGERAKEFASKERLVSHLRKLEEKGELSSGDWILVKGSRGMRMETIISELKKEA